MRVHVACVGGALFIALLFPRYARGAALTVELSDRKGKLLEDAVVTAAPLSAGDASPRAPGPANVVIDQRGRLFRPWVVGIRTGGSVTFANHDDITHHVYSFSQPKQFSFRLQTGQRREPMQFDKPGTVVIGCNIHDWMVGFIHVSDKPHVDVTGETGRVSFEGLDPGRWRITTWHPGMEVGSAGPVAEVELQTNANRVVDLRVDRELKMREPPEPIEGLDY